MGIPRREGPSREAKYHTFNVFRFCESPWGVPPLPGPNCIDLTVSGVVSVVVIPAMRTMALSRRDPSVRTNESPFLHVTRANRFRKNICFFFRLDVSGEARGFQGLCDKIIQCRCSRWVG